MPSNTPGADVDAFLTVAEIADLLKINKQTVRNWLEPGIPGSIHYLDFRVMSIAAVVPVECVAW